VTFSNFFTIIVALWLILLFTYFAWTFFLKSLFYRICIYKRGLATTAEVVYFQDSLIKVQYQPLCHIRLKFQTEDGQVKTENLKVIIRKKDHDKYKVGKIINIKYDPKNLKNISILGQIML
jgi:hypothetical protein